MRCSDIITDRQAKSMNFKPEFRRYYICKNIRANKLFYGIISVSGVVRDMSRDLYQIVGSTHRIFGCKWQSATKNRLSEKSL